MLGMKQKTFFIAIVVLFTLMVSVYVLSFRHKGVSFLEPTMENKYIWQGSPGAVMSSKIINATLKAELGHVFFLFSNLYRTLGIFYTIWLLNIV
jgi:hypothetical protein